MLKEKALDRLVDDIKSRELLTPRDPKDMSYICKKLQDQRFTIHTFWFHCALFRMHSNPDTYEALCKHADALQLGGKPPNWSGMQASLARCYRLGKVWGGMFYPSTLRAGKTKGKRWCTFRKVRTPAQKAKRDVLAFKIVWEGITAGATQPGGKTAGATQPGDRLTQYFKCRKALSVDHTFKACDKARTAFAAFYDAFDLHMQTHTKGWWGQYSFKIMLDVACYMSLPSIKDNDSVFPDAVLSRWPINCPAYTPALKQLLKPKFQKELQKKALKRQLLMHVHRVLSHRLGANIHNFASTTAQLCWEKRSKA